MNRKVILQFPNEQIDRMDAEVRLQKMKSRSAFIRAAVEEKIARHKKARLDAELEAGYKENAALMLETARDFEPLVTEVLRGLPTAIKE